MRSTTTYLVDRFGREVHTWESEYLPGLSSCLLDDGTILRPGKVTGQPTMNGGGYGGIIEKIDWDGEVLWDYEYSNPFVQHHHDVELLPNGNILVLAWEYKNEEEAIDSGRDPDLVVDAMWPDHIIEIEPTESGGDIVWAWYAWDHLVQDFDEDQENYDTVADHPELIDINYGGAGADWMHANAIDYNEELDQILLSVHRFSEIWVIDHSTTMEEAASHEGGASDKGGDILYRWGNPQAYGAGDSDDRQLFTLHDARWISEGYPGAGNILIFNNGRGRAEDNYSSIEEIAPPVDESVYTLEEGEAYGPSEAEWTYTAELETDFYARFVSGAERLENGNTLICDGPKGTFFEVNEDAEIVWRYVNPVTDDGPLTQGADVPVAGNADRNICFRVVPIASDHPAFDDRDLDPQIPVEDLGLLGDFNNDKAVDGLDTPYLQELFTGDCPSACEVPVFENGLGYVIDFDEDGDVDCDDWRSFRAEWTDPLDDAPGIGACSKFLRGDANGDGVVVGLTDAVHALKWFFIEGERPGCLDAVDADGDNRLVALVDVMVLLRWAFMNGHEPPAPGVESCGLDPDEDVAISCNTPSETCD